MEQEAPAVPAAFQPTEVTPSCGRCHRPWVPGCFVASLPHCSTLPGVQSTPGQAEPHGVTLGTVTAPQSHQPLLGSLLPYNWPGLLCSGEPGKRGTPCHSPVVPRERSGQSSGDLPALPPPTSIPLLPGTSRGKEPRACSKVGVREPMHSRTCRHRLEPPKPWGSHRRAFAGGQSRVRTCGMGAMEVCPEPSPISTSTSRLHTSWKRLNTRQE